MKKLAFICACTAMGFLFSCEKYVIPAPEVPDEVSYSADVQPIFDAKCVSCHKGNRPPDLRAEESYNSLIDGGFINTDNPEQSELYQTLIGSHSTRATPEEKATILAWITAGAENN